MNEIIKIENLKELIVEIRDENVLLDADVEVIYGVETKRINEGVKNNPDKFPQNYMFELSELEFTDLLSKFSSAKFAKTRVLPKAFTEKGLYMIAKILRSKQAIDATFALIETFSKIRELSRSIKELKSIMQSTIPITCPQEILLGLHMDAQQFAALLKEQSAMALFREGRLSSGMAASWLDMPRAHFLIKAMQGGPPFWKTRQKIFEEKRFCCEGIF